jgi:5-methylcytosine-specific restriction endonuclease McrA
MQTVVLNADFTYLNTVPWKRAVKLLIKEKAESLKEANRQICNAEGTLVLKVPLVLRLVQMVQTVYRNKVPYSRKNVFIRDNHVCQYCGTHDRLSIDHVLPSSRGGKTSFENCVASCVSCNIKKGNRTPGEANMALRKQPYEPTIVEFLTYKMKHTGVYSFLKDIKIY